MGPGRHNRKAVSTSHRTLPEPRLTSKFTISHFIHQFITHFHYNYMSLPVYLSIYPSFYISIYLSIIYPPLHTGCSIFPARSAYLGSVKSLGFVLPICTWFITALRSLKPRDPLQMIPLNPSPVPKLNSSIRSRISVLKTQA